MTKALTIQSPKRSSILGSLLIKFFKKNLTKYNGSSQWRFSSKLGLLCLFILGYLPSAVAQDLTFNVASIVADANVGQSDFVELEITNNTEEVLTISSITVTGTDADQFTYDGGNFGDPPYTVFPGSKVEFVGVFFLPTSAGTKRASLNVFSDSPDSPHVLSMLGTSEVPLQPDLEVTITNQPSGSTVFDLLSVNVGEPDTITATIRNLGNVDLNITELLLDGSDQFQILSTLTTPLIIAPLDSIVVDIEAFAIAPISIPSPGISTVRTSLSISHDDPNLTSPNIIQLQFFERAPSPSASVSTLGFGNVPINTDSTLTFTLTNNSVDSRIDGDLIVTGFDFGANAGLLSSTTAFPIRLATGQSSNVAVTFSPDAFEATSGTITILGNVDLELIISGQGAIKQLDLASTTLDFGDINRDDNNGQAFAAINLKASGGQPVIITDITFTGANTGNFFSNNTLPFEIEGEIDWSVFFLPGASGKGEKTATMTITSDAINSPHIIELTANAIYPPILSRSTSLISIDSLDRLNTLDTTFTISNTGTEPLSIISYSFGSVSSATEIAFVDYPSSFPILLETGEELPITVRFLPTGIEDLFAEVNLVSNASNGTLQTVSLQATVLYPTAYISNEFSTVLDSLRFGSFSTALSEKDSLLIVNDGTGYLSISGININGMNANDFSLPEISYPIVVPSDSSVKIAVRFKPGAANRRIAGLTTVSNNVPAEMTVGLTGEGTNPRLSILPNVSGARVRAGSTSEMTNRITNIGEVPVNIYSYSFTGANVELFTISGLETPTVLQPGLSIDINHTFTPIVDGEYSAILELNSDAANGPIRSNLTGVGFTKPDFLVQSDTVFIGRTDVGTSNVGRIIVSNVGTTDLVLEEASLEPGSSKFSSDLEAFGLPITIPPLQAGFVGVKFSPIDDGEDMRVLSIVTNDDNASETEPTNVKQIVFVGDGAGPIPSFTNPDLIFDGTLLGETSNLSFSVTNVGRTNLNINFVYPNPNANFNVYYEGYTAPTSAGAITRVSVAPGATQQINVVFSPKSAGEINASINVAIRNAANQVINRSFPVSGIGVEPPTVKFGALTIVGDDFVRSGNIKTLIGNVRINDLELGDQVIVDIDNATIEGSGDVQVTEVPPKGALVGGTVKLRAGGFKYFVDGAASTLSLDPNDGRGTSFFELIGLQLEINDLIVTNGGVQAGGFFALPEVIFGEDAGFDMDNVFISKDGGIDIAGKFAIEAPFTVFEVFSLESVELEFDSFKDCFSGSGSVSTEGAAFELSISAGVVLKNGGLDGVSLEVETLPGIPLGSTGFALAGGNGAIEGLQVPPVSIELGVDIVPVPPGANKVVRFDNVGFKYTFGTSLTAGGNLLLFGMDVAEAGIEGDAKGFSAEAFFNLLEIFKGDVRISAQQFQEKIKVSGNASLLVQIPQIPEGTAGVVGGALNAFLPITLAEVSTAFSEERITASMVYPPVPIRITATLAFGADEDLKFTIGGEFTLFNNSGRTGGRMSMPEVPYFMTMEHDIQAAEKGHLEGESIVINSKINPRGRSLAIENTEFPFSLNGGLEGVIVRVEGVDEVPTISLVLPTGQEVTAENAIDLGYLHTVYEAKNQAHIILANTLPGNYMIKIEGTGQFQIDIAGSEFGPSLTFGEIQHDTDNEEVIINWEDADLDSDAKVSFFYDRDQQGADGQIIAAEISEDDGADRYNWDVATLDNGTYYIYGVIDDGLNTPVITYAAEPIVIAQASPIDVPVLQTATVNGANVDLAWSATSGVHHYLVYYAEEKEVSLRSQVLNAGRKVSFSLPNLKAGRKYQFAVAAVDANRVQSNLSNVLEVSFMSTMINNVPMIEATSLPTQVKVGETYQATIVATDGDAGDVLTYSLTKAPEGMSISENVVSWTPTEAQVGANQVTVKVMDASLATDSLRYTVSVVNEESSRASFSFSNKRFNGLDKRVQVTLRDPGLNASPTTIESQIVQLFSTSDQTGVGLTLTETSANSGAFIGSFGFVEGSSTQGFVQVSIADSVFVTYQDVFPAEQVTGYVLFEQSATPNALPSAMTINNTLVRDNAKIGDLIGVFTTQDVDDNTHTYQLVAGAGSADNQLFKIDGQAIAVNASLMDLSDTILNIRVRAVDSKNGIYEQTFVFSVEKFVEESLNVTSNMLLNEVSLYPNPTSRKVFVTVDSERGPLTITILAADGREIRAELFEKKWNDSKVSMNVADLPPGIYFLQIEQENQMVTKRLIKE